MEEPEALHPFSSNFRSQLCEVLSKPAMVRKIKQTTDGKQDTDEKEIPDEKQFLETEIDSYTGHKFERPNSSKRPPTPPKPVNRTFTFDKTNPFAKGSNEVNKLSLPRYAEVNKTKTRPKIPPKPKIRPDRTTTNTLPHTPKSADENAKLCEQDNFLRVNSLPNLNPEIHHNLNVGAYGNFLQADSHNSIIPGYGYLSEIRSDKESSASVYHMAHCDADYCDVIPESPANVNEYTSSPKYESRYENIYEDVNAKPNSSSQPKLQPSSETHKSDTDYTLMCRPVSDIKCSFGHTSLYENCNVIQSQNSDVFSPNGINIGTDEFPFGNPNRVGLPKPVVSSQILTATKDHVSPSSSCDDHDSSVYTAQSSITSTTASSFQKIEVCFFPPSPPADFYVSNGEVDRPASATSGSSTRSRDSRSRIPVPIKPKRQDPVKTLQVEPDLELPPTPTPSPVMRSKSSSKNASKIELPPPWPPANELVPTAGKSLGSSGKGARWYEKLGCIQTDTIQPSEPYGRPGERKRSKSLNREQKKSQFFLPVEPDACDPPAAQH